MAVIGMMILIFEFILIGIIVWHIANFIGNHIDFVGLIKNLFNHKK